MPGPETHVSKHPLRPHQQSGPGYSSDVAHGKRVVAPFSTNAARSVEQPSIDDEAPAASCSQNNPEYGARMLSGPIDCFGQGEAIGVVGEPHRRGKRSCKVAVEGTAVQPSRIGILQQTGDGAR